MAGLFQGDDTITLTKTEAFRVLAALMDSLELIDRTSPTFEVSWRRLRFRDRASRRSDLAR